MFGPLRIPVTIRDVEAEAEAGSVSGGFVIINVLNTSMQGRNASLFATADKIDDMQRKRKAWKIRVSNNCYDMFPQLATVIDDAGDNLDVKCVQDNATEHLSNLVERI